MRNESNNSLTKTFQFKTFEDAMIWMLRCSFDIAVLDHHPEWKNVHNSVEVTLKTRDAGNTVTDKDHKLAELLDAQYKHSQ